MSCCSLAFEKKVQLWLNRQQNKGIPNSNIISSKYTYIEIGEKSETFSKTQYLKFSYLLVTENCRYANWWRKLKLSQLGLLIGD